VRDKDAIQAARRECKAKGHEWEDEGTYSKCERCEKLKRNVQPVKVVRPIRETGEIVEQSLPVRAFKPERPEFLTTNFRSRVLAGDRPGLIFPGNEDCPLELGQEIELTPNVSIAINRITKTKGGDHRCRYTILDQRATLPRRTPGMFEPPETDEEGFPIPHTKEAIAAATVDGNYCQGSSQAVPDVGEEVGIAYQRVLGTKSRAKTAESKKEEQPMEEARKDLQRVNSETKELAKRAVKMGLDPTIALAPVYQAIASAHAGLSQDQVAA
jgi:hypothetical protein